MSSRSIIKFCVAAFILLIIGLIVYMLIPRASLLFSVAPENVIVTINGHNHKIETGKTITVAPGDLSISVSSENFDTYTTTVTVKNGEEKELLLALKPQTDAAKKLLETPKSQEIIQRIANVNMKKFSQQLLKDYPILSVLPLKDKFYTVTSCPSQVHVNDLTKVAICVNLFNLQAKQSAIDDISNHGFNIDDYELYFVDKSYDPSAQAGD